VRLYRIGDQGEPVRDIQDRLAALGFGTSPDGHGRFEVGTLAAVQGFQRDRGLAADGIVGPDTWRTLVGAGFRLGDRMLYHRAPMMRGDDVSDLQRRLNTLGFDSGKVDGIFGPDTLRALLDFQANRRMAEDGIAGREVAEELSRVARADATTGREQVRERQWLAELPTTLVGQRIYVDTFCRTEAEQRATWRAGITFGRIIQDLGANPILSRAEDTQPTPRVRALRANRLGVDLLVAFAQPENDTAGVLYFASAHSRSSAGEAIARNVAEALDLPVIGRTIAILKDTRPPAVVVACEPMNEMVGGRTAQGIINFYARVNDEVETYR
jgi:N-acetylmuramoyl-L-alanine amidase